MKLYDGSISSMLPGDHPAKSEPLSRRETAPAHPADLRHQCLQQILASRTFAKSTRLSSFLEYICTLALSGRDAEIHEQQIGIHVFGRPPSYNPAEDSVVRSQARLLRQRLEEYFEQESPDSPFRLTVPKGGYVPVFEAAPHRGAAARPASTVDAAPVVSLHEGDETDERVKLDEKSSHAVSVPGMLALLVLGILVVAAVLGSRAFYHSRTALGQSPAQQRLWQSVFATGKPVVIVPSDDALVLFQELTKKPVSLNEYVGNAYLDTPIPSDKAKRGSAWFTSHQYTSTADLDLAMRLGRLPEAGGAEVITRNARVLRIDDMKDRNVVLIGGLAANPWVSVFADRLNFVVNYDWQTSEGYVQNKHPADGEKALYSEAAKDGSPHSYGVFAYLPGLSEDTDVLLFEGTGMAGTESAADFPFNKIAFASFVRHLAGSAEKLPYFEVLLETSNIGGNGPEGKVISYRVIQP